MTKNERFMLLEINKYINAIPNFRNNMDTKGYSMFRKDTIELQSYLTPMSYALLMYATETDSKRYWKKEFDNELKELRDFIKVRTEEKWDWNSKWRYRSSDSVW